MNSSLATVTILVSLLHVAALGVMIWIRVRRFEADGLIHYRPTCTAH